MKFRNIYLSLFYLLLILQDANGSIGLTMNGIEKTPIELIQEQVIVKITSGSDHLACLTDKGELFTMGTD